MGTCGLDKSRQFAQDLSVRVGDAAFDLAVTGVDDERQGSSAAPREAVQHVTDWRTEHEGRRQIALLGRSGRRLFSIDAIQADWLDVDL